MRTACGFGDYDDPTHREACLRCTTDTQTDHHYTGQHFTRCDNCDRLWLAIPHLKVTVIELPAHVDYTPTP